MKKTNILAALFLAALKTITPVHAADAPPAGGKVSKPVAELKWIEPFEIAKQEAKQSGKSMRAFVGNTNSVCTFKCLSSEILHS